MQSKQQLLQQGYCSSPRDVGRFSDEAIAPCYTIYAAILAGALQEEEQRWIHSSQHLCNHRETKLPWSAKSATTADIVEHSCSMF